MGGKIILVIPKISDSLNVWQRQHWAIRRRIKKSWEWEIKTIKMRQSWKDRTTKQKVIITSYRKRKMDYDRLVGGAVPIVDALTRNKLIVDDSPEWVEIEYRQEIDGKNVRTTIEMVEL